ncbi:MAG: hypothetical protein LBS64_01070 [Spirochaetaceae bacterium]|nr:hypothetical protein [Spirochaetaceae bacterium]
MDIYTIIRVLKAVMTDIRVLIAAGGVILFLTLFSILADAHGLRKSRRARKQRAVKGKEGAKKGDTESTGDETEGADDQDAEEKPAAGKRKFTIPNPFKKKAPPGNEAGDGDDPPKEKKK